MTATARPRKVPADAQIASALTSYLNDFANAIRDTDELVHAARRRRARIDLINAATEQLIEALRAALHESVREQPGRAQKGEIERLLRAVGPKVARVLR